MQTHAFLLLFLSIAVLSVGCTSRPAAQQAAAAPDTTASVMSDTLATLERTPCYGICPSYTLTIYQDGTVHYEGRAFVATEGEATAQLSKDALDSLRQVFAQADYFALKDSYTAGNECGEYLTDFPTVITSFRPDGRAKRVRHYHGCRDFPGEEKLTALEDTIDALVGTQQWIKGEQEESGSAGAP